VLGHLELHRAHGGEHRRLVPAQVAAQHLDGALLLELLDAAAELLVAARSRRARDREVLGAKLGIGGKVTGSST
jgi:hypothetical protein